MIDLSKKYRLRDPDLGEIVSEIKYFDTKGLKYPLVAVVNRAGSIPELLTWGASGEYLSSKAENPWDLVEVAWHDGLKDGDPIMVRMGSLNEWSRRHFAGIASNGNVLAYGNGRSKWTNDGAPPCEFSEGRKPTAKELEE